MLKQLKGPILQHSFMSAGEIPLNGGLLLWDVPKVFVDSDPLAVAGCCVCRYGSDILCLLRI